MITFPLLLSLSFSLLCFLDRSSSSWEKIEEKERGGGKCGRSIPRRGYSISRETLEGRGRGPRFRGFYWAGKVVLVKVLSFLSREKKEEKEMPKERPRIDEDYRPRVSIVIQRLPVARARGTALRGNLKRDGDTSSRDLKTIQSNPRKRYFRDNSISDLPILFSKKRKKESHLFTHRSSPKSTRDSIPLIARRGQLSLKPPPPPLVARRRAAKGKLFSSRKLQTEGGEGKLRARETPVEVGGEFGENCTGGYDTYLPGRAAEIYRLDRRSSPGKYTYPDLSRPWTNTYALILTFSFFFFAPDSNFDSSLARHGFQS